MKNTLWLFISLFILVSCEEENPGIIFTNPKAPLTDTSYITANYGTPAYKKILLEDLTGVRCVNCPQAAEKAKELKSKFGDTLVVIGLYLKSLPQFTSPWSGYIDLRTDDAEVIANAIGMPTGLPGGYVDRDKFGTTQASLAINQWEGYIQQRKGPSPVKVWLDYEVGANNVILLKSRITYTDALPDKQHKLALYIVESGIVSKQSTNDPDKSPYIEDYIHEHALRTSVGLPLGQLLNQPLELGRVFEKEYAFEWPATWNRNKAYLVAVILDASNESVVQVEEIKLY